MAIAAGRAQAARGIDAGPFTMGLVAVSALALVALWLVPATYALRYSHDLFPVSLHTLAESAAILVSLMVFAVAWHAYAPARTANLVILGCGFLAVGLLDFGHMLSYQGMPDFVTPAAPQKAVAFWLAGRIVCAVTLVAIAFGPWTVRTQIRGRNRSLALALAIVAAFAWVILYRPDALPLLITPEQELTGAKIAVESVTVLLLLVAALRFSRPSPEVAAFDASALVAPGLMLALASIALIAYASVNDLFSLLGHLYKVIAYYLVYRIVFVTALRRPYAELATAVAENEAARQRIDTLERFDSLTGLPNRSHLREVVNRALAGGSPPREPIALLIANLDGFTALNDSFGHAFGDGVLKVVADRLERYRAVAPAFRLGGDEFAVLVAGRGGRVAGHAEHLKAEITAPMVVLGRELTVTATIGVAIAPDDADTFDGLLQRADTALRAAKRAGAGNWRAFDVSMSHDVVERMNLRAGLRAALERREFQLAYQPQLDLRSGAIVGVEALLRWRHAELGFVAPVRFIPEAEESGLIVPIGAWIVEEACRQAMAWKRDGLDVPVVAVNLSPRQLQDPRFVDLVRRSLEATGLPAGMLEFELTESMLFHDGEAVLSALSRLRAGGVRLAIDDFGTGYSSLGYLRAFPIGKLKIDQSFIRELDTKPDRQALVGTILQLATSLKMQAVAEGVEHEAVAQQLRELGCAWAQGYLYARPMPPAELAAFVAARAVTSGPAR